MEGHSLSNTIYFRGSAIECRRVIRAFVGAVTGKEPDHSGYARGVFTAIGIAALTSIQLDYERKADGETGEDGVKWKPLTKAYLAYKRRFGKGEKARLKAEAGLGRGHRLAPGGKHGLLSVAQLRRWREIFSKVLWRLMHTSNEHSGILKSKAAAIAWATIKREGAKTMLEVFGNRKVQILRDTGILFNSISPGVKLNDQGDYQKPKPEGGDEQLFDWLSDGVIVGTSVKYARAHQHGDPARGIPARPFLPVGDAPTVWKDRWAETGMVAVAHAIRLSVVGAGTP